MCNASVVCSSTAQGFVCKVVQGFWFLLLFQIQLIDAFSGLFFSGRKTFNVSFGSNLHCFETTHGNAFKQNPSKAEVGID